MSAGWFAAADECLAACGACMGRGLWRSAVNRAYYAMFAAATGALLNQGATPRKGWGTWSHEQLPDVVRDQLATRLSDSVLRQVRTQLRRGRQLRDIADYSPAVTVDRETAHRVFGYASAVVRALEEEQ